MQCCQIALSTMDLVRSRRWYEKALGFIPIGDVRQREGQVYADVPGLPEASFHVACLVGSQPFVQIEMFEFARPRMRARPKSWRPCDIGYSMFAIRVPDFDAALRRLRTIGGAPLTPPLGELGYRRVCLLDPDGILIELMEADPMAAVEVEREPASTVPTIACTTLSVHDLDESRSLWRDVFGFEELRPNEFHEPAHEELWGMPGAKRETMVLRAGTMGLEFVRYSSPVGAWRPAGHMISDQGILNVALGSTDRREFDALYRRAVDHGFRGHRDPWELPGVAIVVYLCDAQGFSVELLHVAPESLERMGFKSIVPQESIERRVSQRPC
jgi:catechol 2,3-dioxygenase-like lactoylglutathione lyase family enzyme